VRTAANGLLGRVAIERLRAMGPQDDATVQIADQDRSEVQQTGLLAHFFVSLLAFGDIAKNHSKEFLPLNLCLGNGSLNRKFLTGGSHTKDRTHAAHAAAGGSGGAKIANVLRVFGAVAGGHEALELRAHGISSSASEHE